MTFGRPNKLEHDLVFQETRMRGQIQYTNYVLSADSKFLSSPPKQIHILGNLSYVFIILTFLANFAALISAVCSKPLEGWPGVLSSLAIAFAIIAVGVRATLEGLRPEREIRRMQFYASALHTTKRSNASAPTNKLGLCFNPHRSLPRHRRRRSGSLPRCTVRLSREAIGHHRPGLGTR